MFLFTKIKISDIKKAAAEHGLKCDLLQNCTKDIIGIPREWDFGIEKLPIYLKLPVIFALAELCRESKSLDFTVNCRDIFLKSAEKLICSLYGWYNPMRYIAFARAQNICNGVLSRILSGERARVCRMEKADAAKEKEREKEDEKCGKKAPSPQKPKSDSAREEQEKKDVKARPAPRRGRAGNKGAVCEKQPSLKQNPAKQQKGVCGNKNAAQKPNGAGGGKGGKGRPKTAV